MSSIIRTCLIVLGLLQLSFCKNETQWKRHRLISKGGWSNRCARFDDPIFAYALCNDKERADSKCECMIVLDKDVHSTDEKPSKCTFTLDNASRGIIYVANFGSDKTVFAYANDVNMNKTVMHWQFKTAMIQMSDCRIIDTGLVFSTKASGYGDKIWYSLHVSTLIFEDAFAIVVQGIEACGDAADDSNCVYIYDRDGKLINGPITLYSPSSDKDYYVFRPISRLSSKEGYSGPTNDEIITKMLWKFPSGEKDHSRSTYDSNNGMIGMCSCGLLSNKLSCSCLQTDRQGGSRRSMEIEVRKPSDAVPAIIFLYNLRGGGFFFIPFYTDRDKYFYSMSKINADGRVIGEPIVIGSHSLDCPPDFINARFVEQDDGQYCITLACSERQNPILRTLIKCYSPSSSDWKFHAREHVEL